jgi:hypothetical protein
MFIITRGRVNLKVGMRVSKMQTERGLQLGVTCLLISINFIGAFDKVEI